MGYPKDQIFYFSRNKLLLYKDLHSATCVKSRKCNTFVYNNCLRSVCDGHTYFADRYDKPNCKLFPINNTHALCENVLNANIHDSCPSDYHYRVGLYALAEACVTITVEQPDEVLKIDPDDGWLLRTLKSCSLKTC